MDEKEEGKGTVTIQISMISFLHPFLKIENYSKIGDLEQRRNQKAHHTTESPVLLGPVFVRDSRGCGLGRSRNDNGCASRFEIWHTIICDGCFGSKDRKHTYHRIVPSTIQLILSREFMIAFNFERVTCEEAKDRREPYQ